jgi:hypothetical protein
VSNFLEGYEDVNARIIRARSEYPSLRLVAYIEDIDITKGYILVKAEAYKNYEDEKPSAVDFAYEARSDRGVNLHFWVENAVTSAYGRVIGLLTPGGIARSTKQDMEKVEALSTKDVAPVFTAPVFGVKDSPPRQIKNGVITAAQKRLRLLNASQFGICKPLQDGRLRYE